jgi:hypothetical protein
MSRLATTVAAGLTIAAVFVCPAAAASSPPGAHRYTIRVVNSAAGGYPGRNPTRFYVGQPINITVRDRLRRAQKFELCITPPPIDRPSCRRGTTGRTITGLAPSRSG